MTWRDLRPQPTSCVMPILQDAACAAPALGHPFTSSAYSPQDIFENTGAHFSVFPVVNYAQVKAHCQSLVDGEVRCGLWLPTLRSHESVATPATASVL